MVVEVVAVIIIVMLLLLIAGTSILSLIFIVKFIADPEQTLSVTWEMIVKWGRRWKEFLIKPLTKRRNHDTM